jgi:hypothetical protein
MNDPAWKRLIDKIHEGNVVPIIGPRLLAGADGKSSLQAHIAQRVLEDCCEDIDASGKGKEIENVPLPPFRELNELVSRLKGIVEAQDLYDHVYEAISEATSGAEFAIPAPIVQLSEIADFRLFVTLTPDSLLARSIGRRCAVREVVHSPNLPTSEGRDLPRDWKEKTGEVHLLYLFGKARSAPMFAIHDEDVLEYAHNVIARGSQVPIGFLDELQQRNLLLVGCNFPDWLTRFFLRATNRKRLSEKDNRSWVIEPLQPEESLTCFLRSYSRETEILSQTPPVEFVAELHQRWMATYGAGPGDAGQKGENAVPPGAMFFISYSRRTDRVIAEKLDQALLKLGVTESEVWFDRNTLEPGDDFKRRIMEGIGGCRYFLPVLSRAADRREEGFVFNEWRKANERKEGMNREFLFPIIVDSEYEPDKYQSGPVWEWRRQSLHFGHAPEGDPDNQLVDKLKTLVRDARRGNEAM